MSISKVAFAVSVLWALSLGGCVVDATGVEGDDAEAGLVTWDLTHTETEPGGEDRGGDDGSVTDGSETTDPADGLETGSEDPSTWVEVLGPHPDPWHKTSEQQEEGIGNND